MIEFFITLYAFSFVYMEFFWLKVDGNSFVQTAVDGYYRSKLEYLALFFMFLFLPITALFFTYFEVKAWSES